MREAFVQRLLAAAKKNPDIVLVTGDLGYGVLDLFEEALPDQFINAGVAEQAMLSMAAGIASLGKRVFVYSIGNFPTLRALEQIRNDVCYMNNPVVIVAVGAGYAYGPQGYTHHALEDVAVMRALPNIEVLAPANEFETSELISYLASSSLPAYLRLGKTSGNPIADDQTAKIERGKLRRWASGDDGSILFYGSIGSSVIEAKEQLSDQGLSVAIYSTPFLTEFEQKSFTQTVGSGPILTVEEHSPVGGLGSAVLELASSLGLRNRISVLGAKRQNLATVGDQEYLRDKNGLGVGNIVEEFKRLVANQS